MLREHMLLNVLMQNDNELAFRRHDVRVYYECLFVCLHKLMFF